MGRAKPKARETSPSMVPVGWEIYDEESKTWLTVKTKDYRTAWVKFRVEGRDEELAVSFFARVKVRPPA
jgi:hypothetical protein